MIYAFATLAVLSQVSALWVVRDLIQKTQQERKELEDRLMAICHPIALVQVEAQKNSADAEINYVGEELFSARTGVDNVAA